MNKNKSQREAALEDLLRAWGLHRTPFVAEEKTKELFASTTQRKALELLDTTAALRGVMMLSGSPGTGKSTLIKTWLAGLARIFREKGKKAAKSPA